MILAAINNANVTLKNAKETISTQPTKEQKRDARAQYKGLAIHKDANLHSIPTRHQQMWPMQKGQIYGA